MLAFSALTRAVDDLLASNYPLDGPGAAVIITQSGRPLFRKAYGLANLELCVPLEPDMAFRVGSVTKQFTAVAILMLMEQGCLSLDDPIEKFLPDYPTHGHTIEIEHLLTHTSGIMSYTDMKDFDKGMTRDMTPQEMINYFKNQPMQFAPGKRWSYNNSGYFLLGVIIEKVSGQAYEAFLQEHIFKPLGMERTFYDSPAPIIPHRACGYHEAPDGYRNAPYISMTQPYAAGALASTVDDLACWDAALYTDRLLKPETLQRAWTSYRLLDGSPTGYGYGWAVGDVQGLPCVDHGGGIPGFTCHTVRIPGEQIYVAVLTNCIGGKKQAEELALRAAGLAAGRPYSDIVPKAISESARERLLGDYQKDPTETWKFVYEQDQYWLKIGDDFRMEFIPLSELEFAHRRNSFIQLIFSLGPDGSVESAHFQGRGGPGGTARRIA